jgi:hypothetical protein
MFKLDSDNSNAFEFEFEGETYSVPSRLGLPMARFRRMRKALASAEDKNEALFDEVMAVFDEYVPEVMERITLEQAMSLFRAYSLGEDEEVSLGES